MVSFTRLSTSLVDVHAPLAIAVPPGSVDGAAFLLDQLGLASFQDCRS